MNIMERGRSRARRGSRLAGFLLTGLIPAALPGAVLAYTPGTGTLLTEAFEAPLSDDWEMNNGNPTSPWKQVVDGSDKSLHANGNGPFPGAATKTWTRRFTHPVPADTWSIAFEYRTEFGTNYYFDLEVQQRAPALRKYRLRISAQGAVSLWRTEGGVLVQKVSSANGLIPANTKRWIRLAIEPGPAGQRWVRARIWATSASSEPGGWTLETLDDTTQLQRVHRFELTTDGPRGVKTWIDDLDVWGSSTVGVDSSIRTIYLMELSHLDIGFTEPPDTVEAFYKSSIDQVLANLAADPDYRWTIESGWQLDRWWERSTEAERANLATWLLSGRLSLAAGYANLHTTIAGPEELARSIYWSSRFARQHGARARTWITDDVPGSTYALPELLQRAGIEYYVGGMNTPFGGRVNHPHHGERPFWWVGPDGSRVLSWITFDSYAEAFNYGFSFFDTFPILYDHLGRELPAQEEAGYPWPELLLMRGFDNHYQGFHSRDLVDQWNATYQNPRFVLATPEEFFDMMLATHGAAAFPSFTGDFGAAWAPSQALAQHTEEWVRQAHRQGREAEALHAAGSVVDSQPPPVSQFDYLYRRELEVDEHSGGGGWPGYFTPEEMQRNNEIHLGYATAARDTAAALLSGGLDRALSEVPVPGNAVAAVNGLGRSRDGWVRLTLPAALYASAFRVIDRGTAVEVPFQRFDATAEILFRATAVPAFGYRLFDLQPGTPAATPTGMLTVTATTLENDFYRLVISPTDGALTSYYDKIRAKELIDPASTYRFNRLASSTKSQADGAAAPTVEAVASAATAVDSAGPLLGAVRVTRTGTPHTETIYRLYRNEDRVEIENAFDRALAPFVNAATSWRGYYVTFPFDIHNFNLRTDTTTRFLDPFSDGFDRTGQGYFDWHNTEHALAFWDANRGVIASSDSVGTHHFETLSTLTSAAWSRTNALLLPRMLDKGDTYQYEDGSTGTYTIEPGTSSLFRYRHHFRSIGPAFDPVGASRFGTEALTLLEARLLSRRPGNLPSTAASFFSVDLPGAWLYTIKGADDGNGTVLRLIDLSGGASTARITSGTFTITSASRLEADEEAGTPLSLDGNAVVVPLEAYETATVRLTASRSWSPITIHADRNPAAVHLTWSGGVTPFTVRRALDPAFTSGVTTVVDEQPVTAADDPVLTDGQSWFYLAY